MNLAMASQACKLAAIQRTAHKLKRNMHKCIMAELWHALVRGPGVSCWGSATCYLHVTWCNCNINMVGDNINLKCICSEKTFQGKSVFLSVFLSLQRFQCKMRARHAVLTWAACAGRLNKAFKDAEAAASESPAAP